MNNKIYTKTVMMPIEVTCGDYCWGEGRICQYFDNGCLMLKKIELKGNKMNITNNCHIGKSVVEQMLDTTSSYLHCSMCGCKIDDIPDKESSSEIIDGHIYCGTQDSYNNGCKYKKKQTVF